MAFKDNILEFRDNEIWDEQSCMEVMMSWEAPIMEKVAEFICESNGDILEIGFGLGLCSDYIQAQGVKSHTIVEVHPQIIAKLNTWASNKTNVTIIEGAWDSASLDTYDGIFLDTYNDLTFAHFKKFALEAINPGGRMTWWNNLEEEYDQFEFDGISFEEIAVEPKNNSYTNIESTYYMPMVSM